MWIWRTRLIVKMRPQSGGGRGDIINLLQTV